MKYADKLVVEIMGQKALTEIEPVDYREFAQRMRSSGLKLPVLFLMHSAANAACHDPERRAKIKGLAKAGIEGFSTVMHITRPLFPCRFPWKVVDESKGFYKTSLMDLYRWDEKYWAWTIEMLDLCYSLGIGVEFKVFNDCSARRKDRKYFGSNNVNGIRIVGPDCVRKVPQGKLRDVYTAYIRRTVKDLLNHPACIAVSWSLEGNGAPFELFGALTGKEAGLKTKVKFKGKTIPFPHITNDRRAGSLLRKYGVNAIYSPHLHSVGAIVRTKAIHNSTDGWYRSTPAKIRSYMSRLPECVLVIETAANHIISGYFLLDRNGNVISRHKLDYDERNNPSLWKLKRGEFGKLIIAIVRARG